jgi:hypothetical protein
MCSGCSGDYAGGFEDSAEPPSERTGDRPRRRWNEPAAYRESLGHPGGRGADDEPNAGCELNLQAASQADGVRPEDNGAGATWEILVSATRIVEIRIIEAKSAEISKIRRPGDGEMRAAREHSRAASAKYYRTCASTAGNTRNRAQVAYFEGIAARMVRAFKRCGRWVRNRS